MNATVKVKLAKTSPHYFNQYNEIINNMNSVSFEPYDTSLKKSSSSEYGNILLILPYLNLDLSTSVAVEFTNNSKYSYSII